MLVTVMAIDVLEEAASTVLNIVNTPLGSELSKPIQGRSPYCAGILSGADGIIPRISKCY